MSVYMAKNETKPFNMNVDKGLLGAGRQVSIQADVRPKIPGQGR